MSNPDLSATELIISDQDIDVEDFQQYLFESDTAAIKTFIREMVTQSIVPFMEARVIAWNDQVASKRRGISGRFMSISKRWTGFGPARGALSGNANTASSGSNYDHVHAYYPSDTPEATMRRLADFAFMLRDWKLSYSTYDLLRNDFGNDKAWRYYAACNEMAAISLLLTPQETSSKIRSENLDQMLDGAFYSYLTRCANPEGAIRCLVLAIEILGRSGGANAKDAAKWAARLLELAVLAPLAQTLLLERVAIYHESNVGLGVLRWTSNKRKAAFWNLLASDAWLSLGFPRIAQTGFERAGLLYDVVGEEDSGVSFSGMRTFWEKIRQGIAEGYNSPRGQVLAEVGTHSDPVIDEEFEQLDAPSHAPHQHMGEINNIDSMGKSMQQTMGLDSLVQHISVMGQEDDHFV